MDLCSRPRIDCDDPRAASTTLEDGEIVATESSDLSAGQDHDDTVIHQHMPDAGVPDPDPPTNWKLRSEREGHQISSLTKRWAEVDEAITVLEDPASSFEVQMRASQLISAQLFHIKNLYKSLDKSAASLPDPGSLLSNEFVKWDNDPRRYRIKDVEALVERHEEGHELHSVIKHRSLVSRSNINVPSHYRGNQKLSPNHDGVQTQPFNVFEVYRTPPVHPRKIQSLSVIAVRANRQSFRSRRNRHLEWILRNTALRIGLPIMVDDNDENNARPRGNHRGVSAHPQQHMTGTVGAPIMVEDADEITEPFANEHRRDAARVDEVKHVPETWQVD